MLQSYSKAVYFGLLVRGSCSKEAVVNVESRVVGRSLEARACSRFTRLQTLCIDG